MPRKLPSPAQPRAISNEELIQRASAAFGQRIKQLRERRGLTQTTLAPIVGLSQKYISELELGKKTPSWQTLVRLALGLEVEMSMMFRDDDRREEPGKARTRRRG